MAKYNPVEQKDWQIAEIAEAEMISFDAMCDKLEIPKVMGQGLRLKGGKAQRFPALGILGGLEATVQSQDLAFGLHVFDE